MKMAKALLLRADLQKKLASLRERVTRYAAVQKGDKPHEDPARLMSEANGVIKDLASLVARINRANLTHKLKDGRTLTDALAQRDALKQQHALLEAAVAGSTKAPERYGLSEIKWVAVMGVSKLQKQADDVARKLRELNVELQEANWQADVEDD